ncbi:MAG: DeoR/GlpR family DNA-binding transcription regulator [Spirochaetales bacterium]|uniref:DeoR/GlpR family DNA-binding transcription regulator n=1 Tax=Candidatus Thalassospirochaeta sargassi TaxID=3119039 RepID=A0AAJ1MNI4_9SPIO|nr:DeoR/GlpR family DNA-binding transcription regulator [Spirochaetales bacterium]
MGISNKRKLHIRESIKNSGTVSVADLAQELSVSEMTIRRDLSEMENEGFLKRTHGGAVREVSRSYEPPFSARQEINKEAKTLIAEKAVSYLEEGDTIAVDSGTTALEFARLLNRFRSLTIVTPSIHIASMFLTNPGIETILAGGIVRKNEGSMVGEITRKTFENLYFDKFFLSTAALSAEAGYTEYISEDAEIKRLIISHSKKTIALMDSTKLGRTAFSRVCGIEDTEILITDSKPDNGLIRDLTDNNVILDINRTQGDKNELVK